MLVIYHFQILVNSEQTKRSIKDGSNGWRNKWTSNQVESVCFFELIIFGYKSSFFNLFGDVSPILGAKL